MCVLKKIPIKTLLFVGYPALLALVVMKRKTLLPSLLWICLVSWLVCRISILNISQCILSTWQDDWNDAVTNKLHFVKPDLGDWQSSYRWCRKDVFLSLVSCRIGHAHLTHSYILKKYPPTQYEHCQCILIDCHLLVECNHFAQERKDTFGTRGVVE